mgnify:CR=1 FL=1
MEFENEYLERLIGTFNSFSVEGFNIFALGNDHLPHLICACPNKDFARAVCAILEIAKTAQTLRALNAHVTSHCYLSPKILANGSLGMVATVINDAVYVDGQELEYNEPELLLGTLEYGNFASQFLQFQEEEGGS